MSPGRSDAADVVAAEVEEHDVLGDLLGIVQHLLCQSLVGVACRATRAGARNRPQGHVIALLAHQDFG